MKITYSIVTAAENERCVECGEKATIKLVADILDSDGYLDEVPLCELCAERKQI